MASEPLFTTRCSWCKQPATAPGRNSRGELCPCRCHGKPECGAIFREGKTAADIRDEFPDE